MVHSATAHLKCMGCGKQCCFRICIFFSPRVSKPRFGRFFFLCRRQETGPGRLSGLPVVIHQWSKGVFSSNSLLVALASMMLLGIRAARSLPVFLRQVIYFLVTHHREAHNGFTSFSLKGGAHFFSQDTCVMDEIILPAEFSLFSFLLLLLLLSRFSHVWLCATP